MTCCGMPSGGIRRRRMTRRSEIRCERRRISAVAAIIKARARDARVNQSRPTESGERRPCRCDGVSWNGSFLHRAGQPAVPAEGGQGRLRVKTGQCHGTLGVARISHPAEPIRLRRQLLLWRGARRRRRAAGMVAPDAYAISPGRFRPPLQPPEFSTGDRCNSRWAIT
jgi:hypothetical protein